ACDLPRRCAGRPIGHSLGSGGGARFALAPLHPGGLMDRRLFLKTAGAVSASLALPKTTRLFALDRPSDPWRTFEVTTRVEVLKPVGTSYVWLPAAIPRETPVQRTLGNKCKADGGTAQFAEHET